MNDFSADYREMSREELEKLALKLVDAVDYYELADTIQDIDTRELISIIEKLEAG